LIMPERIELETVNPLLKQAAVQRYVFASKFVKNKRFLDIACTIGYGSDLIKKYQPTSFAVGGDYYFDGLVYGKKKFSSEVSFCQLDALHLPFKNSSFDVVISFETLEHLKNLNLFLKEVHRILNDKGIFVCSTPNKKFTEKVGIDKVNPFHVKEYMHNELKKQLECFFKNVKSFGQSEIGTGIAYKYPFIWKMYRKMRPIIFKIVKEKDHQVMNVRNLNRKYSVREFWAESPKLIFVAEKNN